MAITGCEDGETLCVFCEMPVRFVMLWRGHCTVIRVISTCSTTEESRFREARPLVGFSAWLGTSSSSLVAISIPPPILVLPSNYESCHEGEIVPTVLLVLLPTTFFNDDDVNDTTYRY